MAGDPVPEGWTLGTFKVLMDERAAHLASFHDADLRFREERDRRYSEVNIEREKALKIKETADLTALGLAREIQTYKDEAHNGLLKQWQEERGRYVTTEKFEATTKPLADFVSGLRGERQGGDRREMSSRALWALVTSFGLLLVTTAAVIIGLAVH
jgi:hypothetical protein